MPDFQTQLKSGFFEGVKKGWSSFVWMCKIVIPLSFLVTLLQWTGWLNYLDFLLNPLTSLINLPPEAALPILAGMLINLYACIAIITVVPFSIGQMTLIAVFSLNSQPDYRGYYSAPVGNKRRQDNYHSHCLGGCCRYHSFAVSR